VLRSFLRNAKLMNLFLFSSDHVDGYQHKTNGNKNKTHKEITDFTEITNHNFH